MTHGRYAGPLLPMLEIKDLSVSVHGNPILDGLESHGQGRRGRGDHGAERLRQVDALLCHRRQAGL